MIVVTHVDTNSLQIFLWERFRALTQANSVFEEEAACQCVRGTGATMG